MISVCFFFFKRRRGHGFFLLFGGPGKFEKEKKRKCSTPLRQNPTAVTVKKADLRHNLDLSRLGHMPTEEDMRHHRRYEKALYLLEV